MEHNEMLSPAVSESARHLTGGRDSVRLSGARRWFAHSIPLLPILGVYALITLAIHPALNDELNYLQYAKNLTTHGLFAAGAWGYMWRGPGLPGLLAPLVVLHAPLQLMRIIVGPVFLFASVAVFHRLVRMYVSSERAALVATYVLAAYLPFLSIIEVIHVEPLATLCFTVAAFFMVRSFRGGRHDHLWAGVALALLALSRVEYGYVLLAALVLSGIWLLTSRRPPSARRSALALVVALLLCTPWLAYTYSVTSKPLYWGDSGGLSLYWMTAPGNIGDWHKGSEAFKNPELAPDQAVFTELNRLPRLSWDARLQHIAFQNIKNNPKHYLTNVVNNIGRLLFNAPYSFANERRSGLSPPWGMMLYAVPNAILLGLLATAVFVAARVRRRLGPEILPIAAFTVLGFAVHIPVAGYGRLITPLIPVVAWLVIAVIAPNVRLGPDPGSPGR